MVSGEGWEWGEGLQEGVDAEGAHLVGSEFVD